MCDVFLSTSVNRSENNKKDNKKIKMSGRPVTQSSTQLEFSQAMNDFKTMFPNMETDVIEAVLRYY